jgi:hypothetical protein
MKDGFDLPAISPAVLTFPGRKEKQILIRVHSWF